MNPSVFIELGKILLITIVVTGILRFFKQPVIIGYIISGIIAGPLFFDIAKSTETLTTFSQIGVALLLFMVGLSLNPRVLKEVGKISLITGIGQVLFTSLIGYFIGRMVGLSPIASLYVSVGLSFSSTIVIMKLLSDKKDLETLYGRISVGFLIVQDFIAIGILLIISSLSGGKSLSSLAFDSILRGVGIIIILFAVTIYLLPQLTRVIAKSQEFLLLFSVGWCFFIASIFYYFNFSIEAGALLAGISLSLSPYHFEISSKMKPLRDFFIILFFVVLGSQMVFSNITENLITIIVLSFFVLIGNPLIVMTLMGLLGYTKRNSLLAGFTVAQISEFSLIVVAMGVSVGHVSKEILSIVTAVGLITFAGSTYMILYSSTIYDSLSKYLTIFERRGTKVDSHKHHKSHVYDIILFGYNRIGYDVLNSIKQIKKKVLIVDYDPETISTLSKKGYECRYGDANDSELLEELNLAKAKMIISTIPVLDTNLLLINKIKTENPKAIISVVSHQIDEAIMLYDEGATYVLMPHFLGGQHFSAMINENKLDAEKFLEDKVEHLEHLKHRKQLGHEHPKHEKHG